MPIILYLLWLTVCVAGVYMGIECLWKASYCVSMLYFSSLDPPFSAPFNLFPKLLEVELQMEAPAHRTWMYDRLLPGRRGYTTGFLKGVEEFIGFACRQEKYLNEGVLRCPCKLCKNEDHLTPDEVNVHIHRKGFIPGYWHWTCHGEELPCVNVDIDMDAPSSSSQQWGYEHVGRHQDMVFDAAGITHELSDEEEPPNMKAAEFYAMLNSAQRPLYPGCQNASELSVAVEMLSIKSKHNMSQACFNDIMKFMKKSSHPENVIPPDFRQTKKLVGGLGLSKMKIDCCVNGCMLYYKDDISLKECKFCNQPRYKARTVRKRNSKDVPRKRLHYLPLIPRLQRLYASVKTAEHMRWHYENRREEGVLCHPSDGEAWKHFDQVYPEFASEPRNVRLGLCADGFTPFNQSSTQYSIWPVIVTPYNLPPELCMMTPYMFLTLIIPGPRSPRGKIDVYLQPLIDELQILWNDGVETYDASKKQNFLLRAALMWTINDFPAYGMLSGWSTARKLACPICMEKSKAFRLKHGRKTSWFDCHRQFLPHGHAFRRNKDAFFKNRIERNEPPPRLSGEQVWERVFEIPNVVDAGLCEIPCRGISHNWTKRSIFWDLPYWRHNLLRHNLDVMHIEKNVFDNVFHTVMDNKDRSKDDEKARLDLAEYCRRKELLLKTNPNGKYTKPKAKFCLTNEQKSDVCEWVKGLKMPDGYASNIGRCVDTEHKKLVNMKSHDCHIFMECLLPIAFSPLPEPIWKPLTELSQFFRDLCSTVLREHHLLQMEQNIPMILCKLERIFPPSLFDSMEHLPIHLPYEARVGGPVQYRWMYPFERFLNKLKRYGKNKKSVEGCIAEAYVLQETSYFTSHYFEPLAQYSSKVGANEGIHQEHIQPNLSVFNKFGQTAGKCNERWLTDKELSAAQLHVLLNCNEVKPFIDIYVQSLKENYENLNDDVIDKQIEADFPRWFKEYVRENRQLMLQNHDLYDLAKGPLRRASSWPICFINGYKFHSISWGEGRTTYNSGVCVSGIGHDGTSNDYYGVLVDILELEWPSQATRKLVLFYCDWFDPSNHGMRTNNQYNIVEVRKGRKYGKFDPFIFPKAATQVYYSPYPERQRDKIDWLIVIKTKPRGVVDDRHTLEVAFQVQESQANGIIEDDPIDHLQDDEVDGEEVDLLEEVDDEDEEEEEEDDDFME